MVRCAFEILLKKIKEIYKEPHKRYFLCGLFKRQDNSDLLRCVYKACGGAGANVPKSFKIEMRLLLFKKTTQDRIKKAIGESSDTIQQETNESSENRKNFDLSFDIVETVRDSREDLTETVRESREDLTEKNRKCKKTLQRKIEIQKEDRKKVSFRKSKDLSLSEILETSQEQNGPDDYNSLKRQKF